MAPDPRWLLDPAVASLNHGMVGACPRVVLDAQRELRDRIERGPGTFFLREYDRLLGDARAALASFVGADPADLVFVPNVTTALSAVLRSRSFRPGDEILTTSHAYLSVTNLLRFVGETTGARIVHAAVPFPVAGPDEVLDAILSRVGDRTRLVVVDHVTSPTAIVFPVERIVAELERRGIDVVVDGAHAPGMLPLDIDAIGAAYYVGNCHKWLCSPRGAGFLHVRRDRHESFAPLVLSRGYGSTKPGSPHLHADFDWTGTFDPTAWLSVPAAIRFVDGLLPGGFAALHARNHALAVAGRKLLAESLGLERAGVPDAMLGSMAALPLPDEAEPSALAMGRVQALLLDEHRIDVAVNSWPTPRSNLLRISAQIYVGMDDYEGLAEALRSIGFGRGRAHGGTR